MNKGLTKTILAILLCFGGLAQATVFEWTSGTYEITDGDDYSLDWINLRNSTTVNMTGGNLGVLYAYDTSTFNLQGGLSGSVLQFYGASTINITGGTINGGINMYDNSVINITGGTLAGFNLADSTVANLWGGQIGGIYSHNIVNIYGRNIVIEPYGTTDKLIHGFWGNGTPFSFVAWRAVPYNSQFVIHEIPEPATFCLFALTSLILRRS